MRLTTRLALLAMLALGLAPGTWLHEAIPPPDFRPVLTRETLPLPTRSAGELTIEGVWRLTSPNIHFGSYSALAALPDGGLLAVSDRGRWLRFTPPGRVGRGPRFGVVGDQVVTDKRRVDAEAMTLHPASGRVWIAYEGVNTIERLGLELGPSKHVRPPEMASWPANAGPEAMTRLRDGRFIILGEGSPQWLGDGYPGLLFAGDPVDGAKAEEFGFVPPDSYRATDMATLPDGRVLILLRAIEGVIPPRFSAKLLVADPAGIRAGKAWRGEEIATFGLTLPTDNFEGLAVEPREDDTLTLWLISDDNGAALQRTLLYRLRWKPETQKARQASPARPSEPKAQ